MQRLHKSILCTPCDLHVKVTQKVWPVRQVRQTSGAYTNLEPHTTNPWHDWLFSTWPACQLLVGVVHRWLWHWQCPHWQNAVAGVRDVRPSCQQYHMHHCFQMFLSSQFGLACGVHNGQWRTIVLSIAHQRVVAVGLDSSSQGTNAHMGHAASPLLDLAIWWPGHVGWMVGSDNSSTMSFA